MATIAVIDDNAGARLFLAAALGNAGHEVQVLEPTCLYAVLKALHEAPPDLLVLDLVMPGCPGQTIIRACREDMHLRQLRILLLTAHGDRQLAQFIQSMGNIHYLAKPVSPATLQQCVDLLLDQTTETDLGWSMACNGVVAVVDDSQMSRTFHSACLRKGGFRCVQVEPTELLATVLAIEAIHPDLLVVDFLMPSFRGDALIRAIRGRESLSSVPVLVITASRSDDVINQLLPIGDVRVAFKPISPDDLVTHVKSLIGEDAPPPPAREVTAGAAEDPGAQ